MRRKRKNNASSDGPSPKRIRKQDVTIKRTRRTSISQSDGQFNKMPQHRITRAERIEEKMGSKSKYKDKHSKASGLRKNKSTESKQCLAKFSRRDGMKNNDTACSLKGENLSMQKALLIPCKNVVSVMKDKAVKHKSKQKSPQRAPLKPCIRIASKIKTDLNDMINKICCVDEKTMWIGRQIFGNLIKVQYQKTGKITILKQFPRLYFVDFCFDKKNDELLYCDRTTKCVMSISSNFEFKEIKSLQPLYPTCITISSDNFIFVGLANEYSYNLSEEPSRRQIVKMDRLGKIHLRINSLHDGFSDFMFTVRSTINRISKDLVVIGYRNQNEACIANFNYEGENTFLHFGSKANTLFKPSGLACSPSGNILVWNEQNGDIHILNTNGVCVHLICMDTLRIQNSLCRFSWDFSGDLLIGTANNPKASILIAEYSEHSEDA